MAAFRRHGQGRRVPETRGVAVDLAVGSKYEKDRAILLKIAQGWLDLAHRTEKRQAKAWISPSPWRATRDSAHNLSHSLLFALSTRAICRVATTSNSTVDANRFACHRRKLRGGERLANANGARNDGALSTLAGRVPELDKLASARIPSAAAALATSTALIERTG